MQRAYLVWQHQKYLLSLESFSYSCICHKPQNQNFDLYVILCNFLPLSVVGRIGNPNRNPPLKIPVKDTTKQFPHWFPYPRVSNFNVSRLCARVRYFRPRSSAFYCLNVSPGACTIAIVTCINFLRFYIELY